MYLLIRLQHAFINIKTPSLSESSTKNPFYKIILFYHPSKCIQGLDYVGFPDIPLTFLIKIKFVSSKWLDIHYLILPPIESDPDMIDIWLQRAVKLFVCSSSVWKSRAATYV